ncbi:hypothetical protein QCA50_016740 [Cerrena zonata]|uniref:Uncharacterized protein n=1 Tax=Cerrena zonata TaxID=2478898 RepID=A0AAW0FHI9_9APHY
MVLDDIFDPEPDVPPLQPLPPQSLPHQCNPINRPYVKDDIKTEYHPCSGKAPSVQAFDKYERYNARKHVPTSSEPWLPFQTRGDFEISTFALKAGLNKKQTDALLKLTHQFIRSE